MVVKLRYGEPTRCECGKRIGVLVHTLLDHRRTTVPASDRTDAGTEVNAHLQASATIGSRVLRAASNSRTTPKSTSVEALTMVPAEGT